MVSSLADPGRIGGEHVHFAFWTLAIRFTFARVEMHLWTPLPPRRPEICAIKGVGTTSWFLLPISTCGAPCQLLVWEIPMTGVFLTAVRTLQSSEVR